MSEIELHRKLLGDQVRNDALRAALEKTIRPGRTTVADIGAGTGFISFLARRLGAGHCHLYEYSGALELARRLAVRNRIAGLTFVHAHSTEVRKPPKADLVISETLGNYALEEHLLETLADARRFLKPGGTLMPCALRQFVAPVLKPRLQQDIDVWSRVGFDLDLAEAREISLNNMYVKSVGAGDLGGNAQSAQCWDEIEFRATGVAPSSIRRASLDWPAKELPPTPTAPLPSRLHALGRSAGPSSARPYSASPHKGGGRKSDAGPTVFGFALWWECDLVPAVTISTSPFSAPTHWKQIYLPLLQPVELESGDHLLLELRSDTRPQTGVRVSWKTRQRRNGRTVSEQSQDMSRGRL